MIEFKPNSNSFLLTKSSKVKATTTPKLSPTSKIQKPKDSVFFSHTQSFSLVKSVKPKHTSKTTSLPHSDSHKNTRLLSNIHSFSLVNSLNVAPPSKHHLKNQKPLFLPSSHSFSLVKTFDIGMIIEPTSPSITSKPHHKILLPNDLSFSLVRDESGEPLITFATNQPLLLPSSQSFTLPGIEYNDVFTPSVHSFRFTGVSDQTELPALTKALQSEVDPNDPVVQDERRRMFLKAAAVAGAGIAGTFLLPKKAEGLILGSSPTTGVVGVKDENNTRINPATEETLDQVLKTSDLTFDGGALEVKITGDSGTPSFSDSGSTVQSALVDADRHLQVDVLSSALPASASTETTLQTISFGGYRFTVQYDETGGTYDYVGEAAIGSTTSDAAWRIKRIENTSGFVIQYAGTGSFDQVWDDRATLTYS